MHYLTIPEAIQILNPETEEPLMSVDEKGQRVPHDPVSFWKFVRTNILSQKEAFGKGYDNLEKAFQVRESLKDAQPGDVVALDSEAWKAMKLSLEVSEWPIPVVALQYRPFMQAILKASESPPEKAEN